MGTDTPVKYIVIQHEKRECTIRTGTPYRLRRELILGTKYTRFSMTHIGSVYHSSRHLIGMGGDCVKRTWTTTPDTCTEPLLNWGGVRYGQL